MGALYGCHNKPRIPGDYTVQDGWREYEERGAIVRVPVYKRIAFATQHPNCQHGKNVQNDPRCACCMHAGRGTASILTASSALGSAAHNEG